MFNTDKLDELLGSLEEKAGKMFDKKTIRSLKNAAFQAYKNAGQGDRKSKLCPPERGQGPCDLPGDSGKPEADQG